MFEFFWGKMPFRIDGQWVPSEKPTSALSKKPIKVRLVKRGHSILTVILNLSMSQSECETLASGLKKKLGCGGTIKDDSIEIQGDKVAQTLKYLTSIGIKAA